MHTGSELLETWIPYGGFEIAKRRLKTGDGGSAPAECLVPKWPDDEFARDFPCARQPCLHRIFADCPPDPQRILSLAGRYGLLTVSIPRMPAPGQVLKADALPPEPVEIWCKEIQALRACTELWDSIASGQDSEAARERLGRKISEHLARVPFISEFPSRVSATVRQISAPHSGSASPPKSPVSFTPSAARLPTVTAGSFAEPPLAATSGFAPMPARTELSGGSKFFTCANAIGSALPNLFVARRSRRRATRHNQKAEPPALFP